MPRASQRAKAIATHERVVQDRLAHRAIRMLDTSDEDSLEDLKDLAAANLLSEIRKKRHYVRSGKHRKSPAEGNFVRDLNPDAMSNSGSDSSLEQPWLTEDEHLQKHRVSRSGFAHALERIKDHPAFDTKTKRMAPPEHQLMIFLKHVGTEGSGASNANQRHTFGVGHGTATLCRKRVTQALKDLADECISWPDAEERKKMSKAIAKKWDFHDCVGIADGTLFPLAFEPEREDAPDYSGRKCGHSLTTMITCDHTRRMGHCLAGHPGSAHDNRVFKATKLSTNSAEHFSPMECTIGDSAFENDWFMVSAFKKPQNQPIPRSQENFNEKLASLRITSEHCIGILKGRFPWLRSMRLKLTESKRSLKRILSLFKATVVLHNMLLDIRDMEKEEWIDTDDFSDIHDETRVPPLSPTDILNQGIPVGSSKDARRRRLMHFFEEHIHF